VKAVQREKVGQVFTYLELRELDIMRKMDHPNIIKLYEIYQDEETFYFVLEYCSGGELLQYFISKNAHLGEIETMKLMRDIFKAVGYLHNHQICHRDLKLENFLFEHLGEDAQIKLIDFGLAKQKMDLTAGFKSIVGSPNFIAPEILNRKEYDFKCDVWSLGVIVFLLLSGDSPFQGENNLDTFNRIKKGKFVFESSDWKNISPEAKDLIKKLLIVDPNKRLTAFEALKHPWFQLKEAPNQRGDVRKKSIVFDPKLFKIMKDFKTPGKFKKEVLKVILDFFKNDAESEKMTEFFKKLDTLNKGHITLSEIEEVLASSKTDPETKTCLNELIQFMKSNNQNLELTYTDFLMATLDKNKFLDIKKLIAAFKHFDIDGSGIITVESLKKVMQRTGKEYSDEELKEMIKEFDYAKNGGISFTEFITMIKRDAGIVENVIPMIKEEKQDLNESMDSEQSEENNSFKSLTLERANSVKKSKFATMALKNQENVINLEKL